MEKRFVVISCEHSIKDIEIETLNQRQQLNIFGILSIPIGIESEGEVKCIAKEVTISDGGKTENVLGEFGITVKTDEGKLFTDVRIEENLMKKLSDKMGIKLI